MDKESRRWINVYILSGNRCPTGRIWNSEEQAVKAAKASLVTRALSMCNIHFDGRDVITVVQTQYFDTLEPLTK